MAELKGLITLTCRRDRLHLFQDAVCLEGTVLTPMPDTALVSWEIDGIETKVEAKELLAHLPRREQYYGFLELPPDDNPKMLPPRHFACDGTLQADWPCAESLNPAHGYLFTINPNGDISHKEQMDFKRFAKVAARANSALEAYKQQINAQHR